MLNFPPFTGFPNNKLVSYLPKLINEVLFTVVSQGLSWGSGLPGKGAAEPWRGGVRVRKQLASPVQDRGRQVRGKACLMDSE